MAQTNYTPISLYYSTTASAVPTAANLVQGELAINTADGKLYYEDSSGVVQVLATKSTGSIGGSNTQVQFNNSGSLGGSSSFTWDGTTVTATKFAGALNGTVGATTASTGAFTTLTSNGATTFTAGTASTSTTTGTTVITGGLGVSGRINAANFDGIVGANTAAAGSFTTINASTSITNAGLTSGRVTYAGASGLLTDSANLLYSGTDLTVYGLTVGRGASSIATNTALGVSALSSVTTGLRLVGLGHSALKVATTGSYNIAIGYFAAGALTTASGIVAIGDAAMNATTTGGSNTAVGSSALTTNTTGANNTAIGDSALSSNTTASNNTAVGYQAGYSNTTGASNTTNGNQAGYAITTGANNSCFGVGAGYGTPVGGTDITTGNSNIFVGGYSYPNGANDSSSIVIGYNSAGKGTNTGFINPGAGGVYQGNNSATWSITSDARLKKNIVDNNTGLDKITAIQVRNFEYRLETEITDLPQDQAIKKEGIQLGVIAQELQQILPECVKTESTGVMSVDSDNLTWYMINAIKQLKAEFDAYKATHP